LDQSSSGARRNHPDPTFATRTRRYCALQSGRPTTTPNYSLNTQAPAHGEGSSLDTTLAKMIDETQTGTEPKAKAHTAEERQIREGKTGRRRGGDRQAPTSPRK